jgi:lipoprotein-anchoring transpeptidase ErfK/SrfK
MRRLAPIALLAVLAAACGGKGAAPQEQRVLAAEAHRCAPGFRSLVSPKLAWAAVVRSHATAYRAPGSRPFAAFGKVNANDYPTVFGVRGKLVRRDCSARWLKVALPIKPNGVTGWVRAADVDLGSVRTRILVDVSARRVTLFRGGRPVLSVKAAVSADATPTPLGSFYVDQRLIPEDEDGPFGPGAIGISAFSEVLTGWAQGGPVAIHGTNAPWLVGQAVSNGCIRVRNGDLRRLFAAALAGTPVRIRA